MRITVLRLVWLGKQLLKPHNSTAQQGPQQDSCDMPCIEQETKAAIRKNTGVSRRWFASPPPPHPQVWIPQSKSAGGFGPVDQIRREGVPNLLWHRPAECPRVSASDIAREIGKKNKKNFLLPSCSSSTCILTFFLSSPLQAFFFSVFFFSLFFFPTWWKIIGIVRHYGIEGRAETGHDFMFVAVKLLSWRWSQVLYVAQFTTMNIQYEMKTLLF